MDDFNNDDHAKPCKPPVFDGNKAEFNSWWHQIQLYLETSSEEFTDRHKIQLVLTYMQKGYAGEWAVSYFNKMRALPAEQHYQWDPFEEALLKVFAPLNKVQEAQAEMAQFRQGKMLIEEYLTRWGQLLVKAKCVTVEANSSAANYLIYLLRNNVRKSIVYAVEQEGGMFTSQDYEAWAAKLLEKGQVLESCPGGFDNFISGQCGPFQTRYPYWPPTPRPTEERPPSTTTTATATPLGTATPISERCDATGVVYGGQGRPMDLDRQRGRRTMPLICYNCKEEGHLTRDCPNPRVDKVVRLQTMLEDQGLTEEQKHELVEGF